MKMLTKLTRANQITIPKPIAQRLGLRAGVDYIDVEYADGMILLKPVDLEERIPPETFEKFQKAMLVREKGDIVAKVHQAKRVLAKRALYRSGTGRAKRQ